jgi:large subunit ribosomal protein L13e
MKHNNVIPNNHFRKEWDLRVRTWFNQPARKHRRRAVRKARAAADAPAPADGALRPVVRCQTAKHNMRVRLGRGFSLEELKEAGIAARLASTIGIAVDRRRSNSSVEGMQVNVQRLKEYKAKLIVFPRKAGKVKAGDSEAAATSSATQVPNSAPFPVVQKNVVAGFEKVTDEMKAKSAYTTLRTEMANLKYKGIREKRAAEKLAAEEEKKK